MTNVIDETVLPSLDEDARAALFSDAHTANTFAPTPVSDAELVEIWEMAKWAPTAANFQPLRVLFVRPGAGRDRLVALMNEGNRAKTAGAPAVAVLAYDSTFYEHIPTVMPPMAHLRDHFAGNDAAAAITAAANANMQAAYFIIAARAAGLATGPMAGFDTAGVDKEFFTDGRWRSFLVVNLGHAGENAYRPRMPRLEHDEVLQFV